MTTEFIITIQTRQEAGQAEQELRKAIALAGYTISDMYIDEDFDREDEEDEE